MGQGSRNLADADFLAPVLCLEHRHAEYPDEVDDQADDGDGGKEAQVVELTVVNRLKRGVIGRERLGVLAAVFLDQFIGVLLGFKHGYGRREAHIDIDRPYKIVILDDEAIGLLVLYL